MAIESLHAEIRAFEHKQEIETLVLKEPVVPLFFSFKSVPVSLVKGLHRSSSLFTVIAD